MSNKTIILIHPDSEIKLLLGELISNLSNYTLVHYQNQEDLDGEVPRAVLFLIKLSILKEMTGKQLAVLKATGVEIWIIGGSIGETIAIDLGLASLMLRSGASLAVNITELVRTMRKHGFLSTLK